MKRIVFFLILSATISLRAGEPEYCIEESSDISLTVLEKGRTQEPVSPYLFSKFSEHLGANIYGGMWAEILENPGMDGFAQIVLNPGPERTWLEEQKREKVLDAIDRQVPYRWMPFGEGAEYSFDTKHPLSKPAAGVCTLHEDLPQPAGFEQNLVLPVQRCGSYELIMHLRAGNGESPPVIVQVINNRSQKLLLDETVSNLSADWKQFRFRFLAGGKEEGPAARFRLRIGSSGKGSFAMDSLSLMPEDNLKGWDPEAITRIKATHCAMMRFPGGNFVSGYRWRQGIGNPFERPTVPNPAWDGQFEPNRVGSAEWMDFMALTGCEPLLCINAGDGTPEEALQWLEYFNGDTSTPMGKLRASQGHADPLGVRFVEIGNELYGGWQVGHCGPNQYAKRYEKFYNVLHGEFPDLTYIANGGPKYNPDWNTRLLLRNRQTVSGISVHYLFDTKLPSLVSPDDFYWLAMGETFVLDQGLDKRRELFDTYSPGCFLAVTELMLFPQNNTDRYPNCKTAAEALWYSGFINSCMRHSDFVKIVTYSASMNHGASLQKVNERIFPTPGWLAYTLYSTAEGRYPCGFELNTPFHAVPRSFNPPRDFKDFTPPEHTPLLDAFCLNSEDRKTLNVFIANRSLTDSFSVPVKIKGTRYDAVTIDTLAGGQTMMDSNSLKQPDRIQIISENRDLTGNELSVDVPRLGLIRLTFHR